LKAFHPRRWPVRWRIASVSAVLTLLILLMFALVVGRLASNKLEANFNEEAQSSANDIANRYEIRVSAIGRQIITRGLNANNFFLARDSKFQIVDDSGDVVVDDRGDVVGTLPGVGAIDFGPPTADSHAVDGYTVASQQIQTNTFGPAVYVQYYRDRDSLESTTGRLWLFLGIGVFGGSVLALLAGLAVAGRAMRPISSLTAAARRVADTRDPSQRIPKPEADDEVAELAATLDQMLRELDAARGETQQMMQAQRDFVADASHELRTPLTSILANLELLEARLIEAGADSDEVDTVASALGSSRRMRSLVADLLLLARADAGRTGPRRPCDLREIANTALTEVRVMAPGHRVTLLDGEPVVVEGDPNELHRLIANLIENGVRHTPPGSHVDVSLSTDNDSAVLEVADDGPGLPEAGGDQIFGRFVRGNGGPSDLVSDNGTGLGLAIVKAVATAHGGTVVAGRSAAGGALFTVTLPAAPKSLASVYTPG
jgi:signal transduction histidine kinase